jgi:TetR/AcrR family transcriptional regulator, transcriptional repressor for nem operon
MTDSLTHGRRGKRERLTASAADLLHRQGVQGTTLADIAQSADVPLGNLYYYFKTKDDLLRAVIDTRAEQARAMLATLEQRATPRARLKALARSWMDMRELVAQHGCPFGTLCSDLDRRDDDLRTAAAGLMEILINWAEEQFRGMSRSSPRERALTLLSAVQGAALLTNTLRDPEIMTVQVKNLEKWIDSMA